MMGRNQGLVCLVWILAGGVFPARGEVAPRRAQLAAHNLAGPLQAACLPREGYGQRFDPGADTCDSAVPVGVIPPDYSETGIQLEPRDREWRQFRLDSPRSIGIETIGDPAGSDTNLALYRACTSGVPGLALAFNEDRSLVDYTSRIPLQGTICLRAATYYVDVGSYAGLGTEAPFELRITDGGPCSLPGSDRYEPDDTAGSAKPLAIRGAGGGALSTQVRTIDPEGDLDFARFRLTQPTRVRLRAGSDLNVNTVIGIADPLKSLFVAINDDAAPGTLGSQIETCLPPGSWLAAAVARAFPDVFDYRLEAVALGPCAFESEPNDSLAQAQPLPLRFDRASINGRLDATRAAQDRDVFRFHLVARSGVRLETSGYDLFDVDTVLELYDERGRLLTSDDDGGNGWLSRIETNLEAGTYFVRVGASPFELLEGDAWIYTLNFERREAFPEELEPNDDCAQASPVRLGAHVLAAVSPIGDVDHFEVQAEGSATGGVLLDLTVTSLGDPLLRLFDDPSACLSSIGCDDDGGPGLDPRLVCCVPANALYAIEVRDYQDNHAIRFYSLDVQAIGACIPSGPCPIAAGQLGCP